MIKMRRYADLYGSALPMQYAIERNALANMRRQEPLRSNNFGLKVHTGDFDRIDPKDYMGRNRAFDVDENIFRRVEKAYFN
jgi:hypothetical protein